MSLEETIAFEQQANLESAALQYTDDRPALTENLRLQKSLAVAEDAAASNKDLAPPVSCFARLSETLSGGSTLRKGMLSLVDQGVVSGVNFLTMVLLRRSVIGSTSDAEHELGIYQLGFSIMLLAMCTQNALISTPYAVFGNRLSDDERKQFAGSTLLHQTMLSALISAGLLAVGLGIMFGWSSAALGGLEWMLALMMPFILVREFIRRLAFVHLQVMIVLILDTVVAALQLAGLWALKLTGHLTAATTFCAIGVACAIAGFAALFLQRGCFTLSREKTWPDLRQNWSFGKWAFAAQVVYLVMAYCPSWMLAILAGTDATGRYAASMSLVMIANPLLIGLNNFFGPQAIHAFHAKGIAELRKFTVRITVVVTVAVSLLYVFLMLFGGTLLTVSYGEKMQGQEQVISILSLSMVAYALSIGAENGLVSLNRPETIFWSNVVSLLVLAVAGYWSIHAWGIIGAAAAALIATASGSALKLFWFWQASHDVARRSTT